MPIPYIEDIAAPLVELVVEDCIKRPVEERTRQAWRRAEEYRSKFPDVDWVKRIGKAMYEAEQRELREKWEEWSGPYEGGQTHRAAVLRTGR
jgi:hypothetical protein